MKKTTTLMITVLATVGFACLSGCAVLQEHEETARGIATYATIKATKGDPARADRIEEIAIKVREFSSGEKMITVELLTEAIRDAADYDDLASEDQAIVDIFLSEFRIRLENRFGSDILPEDIRLAVDTVAEWVIAAARLR